MWAVQNAWHYHTSLEYSTSNTHAHWSCSNSTGHVAWPSVSWMCSMHKRRSSQTSIHLEWFIFSHEKKREKNEWNTDNLFTLAWHMKEKLLPTMRALDEYFSIHRKIIRSTSSESTWHVNQTECHTALDVYNFHWCVFFLLPINNLSIKLHITMMLYSIQLISIAFCIFNEVGDSRQPMFECNSKLTIQLCHVMIQFQTIRQRRNQVCEPAGKRVWVWCLLSVVIALHEHWTHTRTTFGTPENWKLYSINCQMCVNVKYVFYYHFNFSFESQMSPPWSTMRQLVLRFSQYKCNWWNS